jgi:hypothetical protein
LPLPVQFREQGPFAGKYFLHRSNFSIPFFVFSAIVLMMTFLFYFLSCIVVVNSAYSPTDAFKLSSLNIQLANLLSTFQLLHFAALGLLQLFTCSPSRPPGHTSLPPFNHAADQL